MPKKITKRRRHTDAFKAEAVRLMEQRAPIAPNLLQQKFTTDGPNHVWVDDITYVWTAQGWGYLAVLLDLFGRRVVGWTFADPMRTELPRKAPPAGSGRAQSRAGTHPS